MSAHTPTSGPIYKKPGFIIAIVVFVATIALIVYHRAGNKDPEMMMRGGGMAQVVSVGKATLGEMPVVLNELGTITPTATVTVLPQLSGYLTEVAYKEGQDVQKGQFLAQIDPRQYQIDKQQAQAQLAKDQAALEQAKVDLARYQKMVDVKLIAEQTYANQKTTLQQAQASVQADQASIAQANLNLAYCRITAPVSGRTGLRLVDVGNYVTASSSTGIVVLTAMKPTTVQFTVPQNELGAVLQRYNDGHKLPVEIWNSDNTVQVATGTLYAIGNQMATGTGTVSLRASIPNEDEALFPNEFVNVRLLVDTLKDVVLVPTPALQTGAPGDFVFVANDDGTVSVQKVTLGPSDGKNTVVVSGLKAGQSVVVDGTDRLSDGAKIKVAGAKPQAGATAETAAAGHAGGKGKHVRAGQQSN